MREIFSAAFWRSVRWYMEHPHAPAGASPHRPSGEAPRLVDLGDEPLTAEGFTAAREAVGQARGDDYEATTGHTLSCGAGFGVLCGCDDRPDPGEGSPGDIGLGPLPSFSAPPTGPPYHYGDNGDGITGKHTGRAEDCTGPDCGPADCEASDVITLLGRQEVFGPCALREGHRGPMHRESGGRSWTALRDGAVSVPRDALRGLVEVARWVSRGLSYAAFSARCPDAKAQRALAALDDAGLLAQFREE